MKLYTNFLYHNEIEDVAKHFFEIEKTNDLDEADIVCIVSKLDNRFLCKTNYKGFSNCQSCEIGADNLINTRMQKRYAKVSIYNCLSEAVGIKLPWGSLTGIRPMRLAYILKEENSDWQTPFKGFLGVSEGKTRLIEQCIAQQSGLTERLPNTANLYVGIPFCVSRCSYCSFTGGEILSLKDYVLPYVNALCFEIEETLKFAYSLGYSIKNVYIGGGTPTALDTQSLQKIVETVKSNLKNEIKEFTVEAGRPDTVSEEKFSMLAGFGVNRVSINPQTFNQRILDLVNRRHSVKEIYSAYDLARKFGFDINMDLIAGLPTETFEEFCFSLNSAKEMSPENITVHTLALKKGSLLKHNNYHLQETDVSNMVDFARETLLANDYQPYYIYRQKYMSQNLENVGYCKQNKQCLYNIENMEETTDIFGCGASSSSKKIFEKNNKIERQYDPKDVATYIEKLPQLIEAKKKLFL